MDAFFHPAMQGRFTFSAISKVPSPKPHVLASIIAKCPDMPVMNCECNQTGLKDPLEVFHAECKGCMDDVGGLFFAMSGQRLPVPV
jgi:hypothetical protein